MSSEERLASATGGTRNDAAARLRNLSAKSLVALDPGPFGGWGLTEVGRMADRELVRDELELTGARDHVRRLYEDFLNLNPKLLQLCTDWQMRKVGASHLVNDHHDRDYDVKVLSWLMRIDESAQVVCDELATRLSRFGVYGRRLSHALGRALSGDPAYVADSLESYHAVWFQLHEDLLATLDVSRDQERKTD